MNPLTSPKASGSRSVLRAVVTKFKITTPSSPMAITLRPLRRLLRSPRKRKSFPDCEVPISHGFSSPSSVTLVGSPTEEKFTGPKMVRFDDAPTYFHPNRRIKTPKSPTKSAALRSCLTSNNNDPFAEFFPDDDDDDSIYEDCRDFYPGFFQDLEDLLECEHLKQIEIEKSRPFSWQPTEFGCTKIDPQDYLHSYWLKVEEKEQQEEIEGDENIVYDRPMALRRQSLEITEYPVEEPPLILMPPPRRFVPDPAPLILNWHQRILCNITDMLVVLCIGFTVHMGIYIFALYSFFNGGGEEAE